MKKLAKILVGSHMFGLNTETSDMDYVEIHKDDNDSILGLDYEGELQFNKDYKSYEVGKFIRLLLKNNPNALELINCPEECIIETSEEFELLRKNKDLFLSKLCKDTFGQYAATQIRKAQGYNKLCNWEKTKVQRKDVLDFCYFVEDGSTKTLSVKEWLKKEGYLQEHCGLSKINHFRDCYFLFMDERKWVKEGNHRFSNIETFDYQGIIKGEHSNDVCLSSIPGYAIPKGIMTFAKDAYSTHCKDYLSFKEWESKRNPERFNTNQKHGQMYDSKNIMTCRRLLDSAIQIAKTSTINVKVEDKREYYLSIKKGKVNLADIVNEVEEDIKKLDDLYNQSSLQEVPNKEEVSKLLIQIRKIRD